MNNNLKKAIYFLYGKEAEDKDFQVLKEAIYKDTLLSIDCDLDAIMLVVSKVTGIPAESIKHGKGRPYFDAKHIFLYVALEQQLDTEAKTGIRKYPLIRMAEFVGLENHATVLYAHKKIAGFIETDTSVRKLVETIKYELSI